MRRGRPLTAALLMTFLCVAVPAAAAGFDAKNAKKVDGLHAHKFTNSAKKRRGKLIATNKKGVLPDNIVALVAEATHAKSADNATHAGSSASAADLACAACVAASELQSSNSPSNGQVLGFNSGGLAWQDDATGSDWHVGGNAGTNPATSFLGTTDNQALDIKVNDRRALEFQPASTPNLLGGFPGNSVAAGTVGATIAGGGESATGGQNRVTASLGTVGGGAGNQAGIGGYATVAGGHLNTASGGDATVGGGFDNTASGNNAAIPGGLNNTAGGFASFAAGDGAQATHNDSFVWSDGSALTADGADDAFVARASGGVTFRTASNNTTGATLPSGGGSWLMLSDRHAKRELRPVSGRAVLRKVRRLPVATWSYRTERPSIRHMGPMAQAFRRRFGLGESKRYIADVDAQGVALAAVKGAAARIDDQRRRIRSLSRRIEAQNRTLRYQGDEIARLRQLVARRRR